MIATPMPRSNGELLRAAWYWLNATNTMPTRRSLQAFLRLNTGKGMRDTEVSAFLGKYQYEDESGAIRLKYPAGTKWADSGTKPEPDGNQEPCLKGAIGNQAGTTRADSGTLTRAVPLSKISEIVKSNVLANANTLIGVANATPDLALEATPNERPPKKRKRSKPTEDVPFEQPAIELPRHAKLPSADPSQPQWVIGMRQWANSAGDGPISALSPDDRLRLARYHAWRWCNCTRDAQKNLKAAQKIAVGLTSLCLDPRYGSITIGDYILAGDEVWLAGGGTPLRSPWAVVARITALPPKQNLHRGP